MAALSVEHQTLISSPCLKSSKLILRSPTISMHLPQTLKSNSLYFQISSSNNNNYNNNNHMMMTIPSFSTKIHCLDRSIIYNQPKLPKNEEEEEEYDVVVGIYNHPEASSLCYHALHYPTVRDGVSCIVTPKEGIVLPSLSGVDESKIVDELPGGDSAIGYVHISDVTPTFLNPFERFGSSVSVAYRGNLENYDSLRRMLEDNGAVFYTNSHAEVVAHLFDMFKNWPSLDSKIIGICQQLEGSYSMMLLTDNNKLIAVRYYRWCEGPSLAMGTRSDGAIVFASHSCALDAVDATTCVRELNWSEVVVVDKDDGVKSFNMIDHLYFKNCIFQPLYYANSWRRSSFDFDRALGVMLATDSPVDCDIVICGPRSIYIPCKAFADTMGVPYDQQGLFEKNQDELGIKNNHLELEGKKVVVVSQFILSVTLFKKSVGLLRGVGAKEVHMRIARPAHIGSCYEGRVSLQGRVGWCYYDGNAPTTNKMASSTAMSAEEIGADSLAFVSINSLIKWFGSDTTDLCFSRDLPTNI